MGVGWQFLRDAALLSMGGSVVSYGFFCGIRRTCIGSGLCEVFLQGRGAGTCLRPRRSAERPFEFRDQHIALLSRDRGLACSLIQLQGRSAVYDRLCGSFIGGRYLRVAWPPVVLPDRSLSPRAVRGSYTRKRMYSTGSVPPSTRDGSPIPPNSDTPCITAISSFLESGVKPAFLRFPGTFPATFAFGVCAWGRAGLSPRRGSGGIGLLFPFGDSHSCCTYPGGRWARWGRGAPLSSAAGLLMQMHVITTGGPDRVRMGFPRDAIHCGE